MPPHCDTKDGPVVQAAKKAIESGNVKYILPWVKKEYERELSEAFDKTLKVRGGRKEAAELADTWFFETAVRLHRLGEGASYIGLKPAGLDEGPVIPKAEHAIEDGDPSEVVAFMLKAVEEELLKKFRHVMATQKYDENNVDAAREYVNTMLDFLLYSHHLYKYVKEGEKHHK